MTDWLVTGGGGMLGRELREALGAADARVLTRADLDVLDRARIAETLDLLKPRVVINLAADTRVDEAELTPGIGHRVNALAPGYLAAACVRAGAALVHVSTDYVFDGARRTPYGESDPVAPLMRYGRAKAAGEAAALRAGGQVYVVRTCRMYSRHGPSFVRAIGSLLKERDIGRRDARERDASGPTAVEVVDSQASAPVWAPYLASRLIALGLRQPAPGLYHCTSAGSATLYDFARAIAAEVGADPDRIRPVGHGSPRYPARRPAYSVLDNAKWGRAGLPVIPDWRDCLREAFQQVGVALIEAS
ncbi:dTDP-4-dehydrorhamnose reductase [Nonomuraea sp. NPDC049158]|uniref:dTDP-4-dehydrorhamnose reductase n=1 Tax=Nonomuraea sp. NPDC049158 TaxID=3155649 RepID=UPI0033C6DF38